MIVVRGIEHWHAQHVPGPVLTLGNFDGVHRGHRALIDVTRAMAEERSVPCALLTFDPAPRDVLRPGNGIARIQSLERKLVHLQRAGVDAVILQPFDRDLAALSPERFAGMLGEHLGVSALAVGHDFRFGHKRAGNAQTLRDVLGVEVREVPALQDEAGPISSSRIREALHAGDVARAAVLLGRPHEILGHVVHGDKRGRQLGFPTANLWPEGGLLPPNGVYAVHAEIQRNRQDPGQRARYPGVANLGLRPTVAASGTAPRLEVHLFEYDGGALYGEQLLVELVARIRDELRFDSLDALAAQIARDAERARALLGA